MQVTETSDWKNFTDNCRGLVITDQDGDVKSAPPVDAKEKDVLPANLEAEGATSKSQS
jgi:hypothetical protein